MVIDGSSYSSGTVQMKVPVGEHKVESPAVVQIDDGTRLRFVAWRESDTTLSQERTSALQVLDDVTLEGVYATQYHLAIMDGTGRATNELWYDSGETARFVLPEVNDSVAMEGFPGVIGGLWRFQGWLDNGRPISPNSAVTMNGPHTITPDYAADYTITVVMLLTIICAVVLLVIRTRGSERQEPGEHMLRLLLMNSILGCHSNMMRNSVLH
jgi:hypothetical protein